MDFVPVILFLSAGIFVCRIFKEDRYLVIPVLGIFLVGFTKALCKLLSVYDVSFSVLDALRDAHVYLQAAFYVCLSLMLLVQVSKKIPLKASSINPNALYAVMVIMMAICVVMIAVPKGAAVASVLLLISVLILYGTLMKVNSVSSVKHGTTVLLLSLLCTFVMIAFSAAGNHSGDVEIYKELTNSLSQLLLFVSVYRIYLSGAQY